MGGQEMRITSDGGVYRYGPVWSPDSKKLLYWDKVHQLWFIGLDDKKPILVDKSDYGDIADGSWSPDSLWITYSKPHRRGSNDVFLYSLGTKQVTKVSVGFYSDNNPVFDDGGKYLYFISTRYFYPSVGQLDQRFNYYSTDGVFAVTLKADEASPFKPQSDEDKVLLEGIDGYDLDKEGKKVIYKAGPVYGIVEAAPGKAKVGEGKLNLSELQVKIDPREEWRQVFREAWRIERDFYWDPHMTGHNWKKIGERYEALLPWVAHRSDLNYLIGEMIAELSTSHTYVSGGDQPAKPHVNVGMLGADLEPDGG